MDVTPAAALATYLCGLQSAQRRLAAVARRGAELFLDPEQLVVLGDAVGAAERAGLDLAALVATAMSAMVASSVSPERWEMTAV